MGGRFHDNRPAGNERPVNGVHWRYPQRLRMEPATLPPGAPQIGLSVDVGGCPRDPLGVRDHLGASGADFALASFAVGTEYDPPPYLIKF
jgi:hypothetical protein